MRYVLICLALTSSACAVADGNSCHVVGIADGDTLTCLVGNERTEVRLVEIDAPEKDQPYGKRSRQSLSELCFDKRATLARKGADEYGRVLARVQCGGVDANVEQLRRGMAWVYDQYVTDRSLYSDQNFARSGSRGLWAEPNPTPPWTWRHSPIRQTPSVSRSEAPHAGGCRIKGNINDRGDHIYHVPGQKYYDVTQISESRGERWFCKAADARAAGWRPAKI